MTRADVIVVGLGPAGASAAAAAAAAGARVVGLDRRRVAGAPVQCAELVPRGLDTEMRGLDAVTRQPIARMVTAIEEDAPSFESGGFHGRMIDRAAFDRRLVAAARTAGAECRFAVRCLGLDRDGKVLLADGGSLTAPVIVAADGPRSAVGRAAGLANRVLVETRQVTVPLTAGGDAAEVFLSERLPGGYGWLFPTGRDANLGVGAVHGARGCLKAELARLRARLQQSGRIGATARRLTGGTIPAGGPIGPVGRIGDVTVLLAGDAAGLANPVSGAGIAAACLSGHMAGAAAAAATEAAAYAYAEEIEALFGPSLRRALARLPDRPGVADGVGDWQRSWIGFPEYWR